MLEDRTIGANDPDDGISPEALDRVLKEVPKGALALAALTVGLLILAYFAIYLFVYIPRGMVG